jgi:hypothetical protein
MSTERRPATQQSTTTLDPRFSSPPPCPPEQSATSLLDEQIEKIFANLEVNKYLAKCSRTIISEPESERLQFLNQEITNLREQLDTVEDWNLDECTPLKYQIILYEEERNRMAREAHARALKDLRAREMRSDRSELIREDLAWSELSISALREQLKKASPEERSSILDQLNTYADHVRTLLAQSVRVTTDPSVEWMAEPELEFPSAGSVSPGDSEPPNRLTEEERIDARSHVTARQPREPWGTRAPKKASRRQKTHGASKRTAGDRPIDAVLKLASLLSSLATSR